MEKSVVKSLFKVVLVLSMMGTLFSCATSPDEMVLLDRSIMSYERAIRWGDFTRAKSFHKSSPTFSDIERRRLKFYRVTDYDILRNDIADRHNAHLFVEVKYHKLDQAVIRTIAFKQNWKRDKDSKTWYIDSSFPKFR